MATTYVFYDGSIAGQMVPPKHTPEEDEMFILRNIVDFSKQTLEAGEGDIAQVLAVPAGTTVVSCWLRVITAETTSGTVDLGYAANNTWGDALAVDTAAGGILGATHDWVPIYFEDADTIDITATTDTSDVDIDGCKVEVTAVCLKSLDTY
jgi:hypothetical protein